MADDRWNLMGLLGQAQALLAGTAHRAQRHLWLIQVVNWVRSAPLSPEVAASTPSRGEAALFIPSAVLRVQHLLALLESNPPLRAEVVQLLGRAVAGLDIRSLLADLGLGPRQGFWGELGARMQSKLLPRSPDTTSLGELFPLIFSEERDADWLRALADTDARTLERLQALVMDSLAAAEPPTARGTHLMDAMTLLCSAIRASGLSTAIRQRISPELMADAPFRQLAAAMERVRLAHEALAENPGATGHSATDLLQAVQYLRALLERCSACAASVLAHLEEHGVSVDLVFEVDQLQARVRRVEALLTCMLSQTPQATAALPPATAAREGLRLAADLAQAAMDQRSVLALMTSNYSLLARKVTERSAETGEHYITRNRAEYRAMLGMAAGGGAVMGLTTFGKFAIGALTLSAFWGGFWAGVNYAASFVLVQCLHFTVATKQPAMTAPAMAHKLAQVGNAAPGTAPERDIALQGFVDEVSHLIRSQAAGIFGNLALVIPVVVAIQLAAWGLWNKPLVSAAQAHYTLEHLTLLGPTPLFAAFTGVLLFMSSLIAGWTENWFVWHRLDSALRWNPRITAWLGESRAQRWAQFLRNNISGLAANISLGMMLGLVPAVASFFGLPLEVRHITLATGQLAAAASTLGLDLLSTAAFWWCVAGIALTGLLNVGVSFALAFTLALQSRGNAVIDRARVRRAVLRRLVTQPLSFLVPPKN
jgi:site-specific recombinase